MKFKESQFFNQKTLGNKNESYYKNEDEYLNISIKSPFYDNFTPFSVGEYTGDQNSFSERLKRAKEFYENELNEK